MIRVVQLLFQVGPRTFVAISVVAASTGLLTLAEVHLLRKLVNISEQIVSGELLLAAGFLWGGVLGAAALLNLLAGRLRESFLAPRMYDRVREHVEGTCYSRAQEIPLERFEDPSLHDKLQRVRRGVSGRMLFALQLFWESVSCVVTAVALLAYLIEFHWLIPLLLVVGTTPGALIRRKGLLEHYLLDRAQTSEQRRLETYRKLLTDRANAAEIRLFGLGPHFLSKVDELWSKLRRERLRLIAREAGRDLLTDTTNALVLATAFLVGIWLFLNGRAGLDAFAAVVYAVERFQASYWNAIWNLTLAYYRDMPYVRDYFEIVDASSTDGLKEKSGLVESGRFKRRPPTLREGIAFENVSFNYPGSDKYALREINAVIRPGERIALVGENGAGKSTFAKLLMGLYRPTRGRILVDGVDLSEIPQAEWHRRVSAVFQNFIRYQATVRENILFGSIDQRNDVIALERAARQSSVASLSQKLPAGLDTPLGKEFHNGADLSLGQWQKLAIARAYFRKAELLILDEPVSALDPESEKDVYRQFMSQAETNTTLVMISHRLASCRMADRILVFHQGRIIEEGSHDELMRKGGEYAQLFELQAHWYRDEGPIHGRHNGYDAESTPGERRLVD